MKLTDLIILAVLFLLVSTPKPPGAEGAQPLSEITVMDGDTLRADIDLGYGVTLKHQTVRMMGFDAWEISKHRQTITVTDDEIVKGNLAKAALTKMIDDAKTVEARESGKKDPYGRQLLWIYIDGQEVGSAMRKLGHERHD